MLEAILGPTNTWLNNCFAVCCEIIKSGIIEGRPVYGHYYGPVAQQNTTFPATREFHRHGWIVNGSHEDLIIDPTRWTFTMEKPSIFFCDIMVEDIVCENCDLTDEEHDDSHPDACVQFKAASHSREYDEGGSRVHKMIFDKCRSDAPPFTATETHLFKVDDKLSAFIKKIIPDCRITKDGVKLSASQVAWLGDYPPELFGERIVPIYQAVMAAGHRATIPVDFRRKYLREHFEMKDPNADQGSSAA